MKSVLGDVRAVITPLSISNADGAAPGGGILSQKLATDGTAPYSGAISPSNSGGINVHFDTDGLPVFVSSGRGGDLYVGVFNVYLTDSSSPKRSVLAVRFTVTHSY